MEGNGANGDRRRLLLLIPLSCVISAVWVVAGIRAAATGDVQAFLISTGPFTLMVGYVFGVRFPGK